MKKKLKIFVVIILTITMNLSLTGCWNSREINSLAFITAMGFDKTENGMLVTIQVFNSHAIASQKTVNEAAVVVYTEEGIDTLSTIRKIITQSPRKLNGTHIQTVIFGEEFAKEGISTVLDFFSREHQTRTNFYFAVAKGTTANIVLNTLTKLDINPSIKISSSIKASDEVWAGTKAVKMIELVNTIISDGKNPVLSGIEVVGDKKTSGTIEELKETKADSLKIMDLAVFQKDKFVGWLNENESKGLKYILGKVPGTVGIVEDKNIGRITCEVVGTKSKQQAILLNEKLSITVDIDIKVNIDTVKGDLDVTKAENIQKIEKLSVDKVTNQCYKTIEKAQKELDSDIFGFGEVVRRAYPKLWKPMKENWSSHFKDLPVKVNVIVKIEGTGTIGNSFFMKEKK